MPISVIRAVIGQTSTDGYRPAPSAATSALVPAYSRINPAPKLVTRPYSAPLRPRPRLLPVPVSPSSSPCPHMALPAPCPCPRPSGAWSVAAATRAWEDPDVPGSQHGGGGGRVRPEGARRGPGALGADLGISGAFGDPPKPGDYSVMEEDGLGGSLRHPKSPEGRQQQPGEALGLGIWI